MEPFLCEDENKKKAEALMRQIATDEKHWPDDEVDQMLSAPGFVLGVFEKEECLGAAKVTYNRPFQCELPPFDFVEPDVSHTPCYVELIVVDQTQRRSVGRSAEVLDALVKGLYRLHRDHDGTHIYALCEDWTFAVLTDAYVKIVGEKVGDGQHYWCGTNPCPGPNCQLTYVCVLDMRASERRWIAERPDFWQYLNK